MPGTTWQESQWFLGVFNNGLLLLLSYYQKSLCEVGSFRKAETVSLLTWLEEKVICNRIDDFINESRKWKSNE